MVSFIVAFFLKSLGRLHRMFPGHQRKPGVERRRRLLYKVADITCRTITVRDVFPEVDFLSKKVSRDIGWPTKFADVLKESRAYAFPIET